MTSLSTTQITLKYYMQLSLDLRNFPRHFNWLNNLAYLCDDLRLYELFEVLHRIPLWSEFGLMGIFKLFFGGVLMGKLLDQIFPGELLIAVLMDDYVRILPVKSGFFHRLYSFKFLLQLLLWVSWLFCDTRACPAPPTFGDFRLRLRVICFIFGLFLFLKICSVFLSSDIVKQFLILLNKLLYVNWVHSL